MSPCGTLCCGVFVWFPYTKYEKCRTTLLEAIYYFIFASVSFSFHPNHHSFCCVFPSVLCFIPPFSSPLFHPSPCFPSIPGLFFSVLPSVPPTVCPSDRGDVLWRGGDDGSGVHWYLPSAGEQRHGVQPAGASQQGHGHQHCWGGVQDTWLHQYIK